MSLNVTILNLQTGSCSSVAHVQHEVAKQTKRYEKKKILFWNVFYVWLKSKDKMCVRVRVQAWLGSRSRLTGGSRWTSPTRGTSRPRRDTSSSTWGGLLLPSSAATTLRSWRITSVRLRRGISGKRGPTELFTITSHEYSQTFHLMKISKKQKFRTLLHLHFMITFVGFTIYSVIMLS